MSNFPKLPVWIGSLLLSVCVIINAQADAYRPFPGPAMDRKSMRAQEKVEELYQQGDFRRSLIIYQKELAPTGDKYAQYMVGFMRLNGQGTTVNRPLALAWYRLAAERKNIAIIAARDNLFASLSAEEIAESNTQFARLYRSLGDNHIIVRLIRKDLAVLKERTGTRIAGGGSGPLKIVTRRYSAVDADSLYGSVAQRLETRLKYLDSHVEISDIDTTGRLSVKESLETELRNEVAALELR